MGLLMPRIPESVIAAAQEVSLIGADPFEFEESVLAVQEIHAKFGSYFHERALIDLDQDLFEGELGLTFATRFFTPAHVCQAEQGEDLGARREHIR